MMWHLGVKCSFRWTLQSNTICRSCCRSCCLRRLSIGAFNQKLYVIKIEHSYDCVKCLIWFLKVYYQLSISTVSDLQMFQYLWQADPLTHLDHNTWIIFLVFFQAVRILAVGQKRRIYDITNVLEGIGLIMKISKSIVKWK